LFTGSLLYTGFYVEGGGDALLGLIIISPYLLGMMVVGVVLIWVASRVRKRR